MNAKILNSVDATKNSRIQWTTYGKSDITKFGIECGITIIPLSIPVGRLKYINTRFQI